MKRVCVKNGRHKNLYSSLRRTLNRRLTQSS